MPDIATTPLISTLERYLSLTTASQQRTTSNMANIDTPGYRTREVDFRSEMRRAMNAGPAAASFDNSGLDEAGFAPQFSPAVHEVRGLLERPDGNNVSLDREGMMLSQTQLQFQLGEQLIKHEFHQLLAAISGGA